MLEVRLSKKDARRILCGACQKTLAYVRELLDERGALLRYILLPEGWAQDSEGIWRSSGHGRRQLQRGHHLANARRPEGVRRLSAKVAATPRPTPSGPVTHPHLERAWRVGQLLTALPAELACSYPRCGQRQMLDPTVLQVTTADSERGDSTLAPPYPGAVSFTYIGGPEHSVSDPRAASSPPLTLEVQRRRLLEHLAEHDESM